MIQNLFEICWETCAKVGGIYTVLTSKMPYITPHVENYFSIGYFKDGHSDEFSPMEVPEKFQKATQDLEKLGIKLHFGKWITQGYPNTILVEYIEYSSHINEIKSTLWEKFSIDSMNSNWYDFDEAILWSWTCGIVIERLSKELEGDVHVHSHEWMSGGAILYLKTLNNNRFKTIFTTHATMLGRAYAGNGFDLYSDIEEIDPNKTAYDLNVQTKYLTEKALANFSDCFTTVSHITDMEAAKFYSKSADVILFNGFDNFDASSQHEFQELFYHSREKTNNFLKGFFNYSYEINPQKSTILYTSGRNEFRNKGIDVLINSLGKLNKSLKKEDSDKTVISLFLIPVGDFPKNNEVFDAIQKFNLGQILPQTKDFAPLCTHNMPDGDLYIKSFLNAQLFNGKGDTVKVLLMPFYIGKNDGVLNREYYDVISGLDLGVFASYYEPWGYTPLESIAYAVPTITSDLAGFGRYVYKNHPLETCVKILKREKQSFEIASDEMHKVILEYLNSDKSKIKSASVNLSKNFSWNIFVNNYLKAYEIASNKH